jgi:hypothetical protein
MPFRRRIGCGGGGVITAANAAADVGDVGRDAPLAAATAAATAVAAFGHCKEAALVLPNVGDTGKQKKKGASEEKREIMYILAQKKVSAARLPV